MRTQTMMGLFFAALTLGALLYFVWPRHDNAPITCSNDEQCGGVIKTAEFCKEGALYGSGQQNICTHPGTSKSECVTTYDPWKISDTCGELLQRTN